MTVVAGTNAYNEAAQTYKIVVKHIGPVNLSIKTTVLNCARFDVSHDASDIMVYSKITSS